ncbi:hypothetical protein GLYMA_01G143750v4 [Glycine max]|nr:hypothetical protein GLYMA_01G143750v4 [Glycine max]KAH1163072.1 hypothetical protein GYH30_001562 [Glycine max]
MLLLLKSSLWLLLFPQDNNCYPKIIIEFFVNVSKCLYLNHWLKNQLNF